MDNGENSRMALHWAHTRMHLYEDGKGYCHATGRVANADPSNHVIWVCAGKWVNNNKKGNSVLAPPPRGGGGVTEGEGEGGHTDFSRDSPLAGFAWPRRPRSALPHVHRQPASSTAHEKSAPAAASCMRCPSGNSTCLAI